MPTCGNLAIKGAGLPKAPEIAQGSRSEEHTSELQSRFDLVCRLLLEKKKHGELARRADRDWGDRLGRVPVHAAVGRHSPRSTALADVPPALPRAAPHDPDPGQALPAE